MHKIFAAVFAALFLFYGTICNAYAPNGKVVVSMLDIGHGDAVLIETPYQNVLIDTGNSSARNKLVAKLKEAGISRLERIILSRQHADLCGGVSAVLDNFPVDLISDNGVVASSPFYAAYRDKTACDSIQAGDVLDLGGGVKFHVFWPPKLLVNNINNGVRKSNGTGESIVGKLTFGEFAMLFAGDADSAVEDNIVDSVQPQLKALILKAGNHGSDKSSSRDFVASVSPDFVFISAGKGNRFGYPHKDAIAMFREYFVLPQNIFCTRFNGSVRVESDGKNNLILVEQENDWVEEYTGQIITVTRIE